MTEDPRTQSAWQHSSQRRLRRRFTIMGATLAAIVVVGLLVLKGVGLLPGGQGGSAGCGLAIKPAEAHETDCKEPNGKPKPSP